MPSRKNFCFLNRRHLVLIMGLGCSMVGFPSAAAQAPIREKEILETMKRASEFMVEKASYKGGYVWSYLPDFSRRWGEMEAYETMIWVQPPGTASMGHLFLDAYHATGDEFYYRSAEEVAGALIWGQHPSGGWNYLIDFAGETSIRKWYDTIGKNGWRLEEFQYYYGNATFDDVGTAESSKFLLRLYLEKRDDKYKRALDKALRFVLDSQYPVGGWPQRFPKAPIDPSNSHPDYPAYITFNDDVAEQNIEFLVMVYQTLGDDRVLEPIKRAMNSFVALQMAPPQPGWSLQYSLDLEPAAARTYEPLSLSSGTTASNIEQLMSFYRLTGDPQFISRIPEALDWLDSIRLPEAIIKDGRTHPTFVELDTNKPLFVHRRGSNVVNGEYYVDDNPEKTISHYGSMRAIDVAGLRNRYEELVSLPLLEVTRGSPLKATEVVEAPRFYAGRNIKIADMNSRTDRPRVRDVSDRQVTKLVSELNGQGYWPTLLRATSNPYIGPGSKTVTPGDFSITRVGDKTDTSPYYAEEPTMGISTGAYIKNMSALIQYVVDRRVK